MSEKVLLRKLRDKVEELLGIYYYELYDYFLDVASSVYDCKILITRRCLALYLVFLQLFEEDAKDPDCKDERLWNLHNCQTTVISDQATAQIRALPDSASVLLVDDVVIHGNRLWNAFTLIAGLTPSANVTTKVYMLSNCTNSKNIPDKFWKKLLWTDRSEQGEWMELSNRIVSVIYCANIPYISHLGVYRIERAVNFLTECPAELVEINNTNPAQKRMDTVSRVIFCDQKRFPFFEAVSLLDCVRIYESPYDSQWMVVPYSFTKALRADMMQAFFEKLANALPAQMSCIKSQLLEKNDISEWDLYRMRIFKALVSQMFGVCFFHNRQPISGSAWTSVLKMSFNAEIVRELMEIKFDAIQSLLKCGDFEPYFCEEFKERSEFIKLFELAQQGESGSSVYLDYIHLHRSFEEDRLKSADDHYRGKYPGLSVNYLIRAAGVLRKKREVAAQVLNLNDSGCATSTYALSDHKEVYTTFLANGEQSFRIPLERYPFVIRKMIFLENRGQDVKIYLEALFDWWAKAIDSNVVEKRKKELLDFYDRYKGELYKMNVFSILENPDCWDKDGTEDLRKFHKKYFAVSTV